jgi:hypothetical protein
VVGIKSTKQTSSTLVAQRLLDFTELLFHVCLFDVLQGAFHSGTVTFPLCSE